MMAAPQSLVSRQYFPRFDAHGSFHGMSKREEVVMRSSELPCVQLNFVVPSPFLGSKQVLEKLSRGSTTRVLTPNVASPSLENESLDAWDDEYDGVIIDPESLPLNANAFSSLLRSSLTVWKQKILVVKEKCPCRCAGVWKLPTGYIDKSEEIFSGAIREVKEETGVDTTFLEMVAFRHAQLVAFEKSDLMFVCMLKPRSFEIAIDEKEIKDAKWISRDELIGQPFYSEDQMSKRVIEICMEAYENRYDGFIAHQLASKFDENLSYLYYKDI